MGCQKKRKVSEETDNDILKKKVVNEPALIVGSSEESQSLVASSSKELEVDDKSLSSSGNIEKSQDQEIQEIDVADKHQVKCDYCQLQFNTRSRLLQHLCVTHYPLNLLELYPYTKTECPICQKEGRPKPFIAKQKASHLCHIGQAHEIVMDIIPEGFKNVINKEFKKRYRKTKIKEEPLDDSVISISSQDSFPSTSNSKDSFQSSFAQFMTSSSEPFQSSPLPRRVKKEREFLYQDEDANMSTSLSGRNPDQLPTNDDSSAKTKLLCSLCDVSDLVTFSFRSEMLKHLSEVHLTQQLLTLYPMPSNNKCILCIQNGNNETFEDDSQFVEHIGRYHEKVLEILPSDFCDRIEAMSRSNETEMTQFEVIHSDDSFNVSFESSLNSTKNDEKSNEALNTTIVSQTDTSPSSLDDSNSESQDKIARFVELSNIVASKTTGGDELGSKVSKCKHCEEVFLNAEERMQHIQIKHGKKKTRNYSCRYCESHFNDPKQFKHHLIAHKKDLIVQ